MTTILLILAILFCYYQSYCAWCFARKLWEWASSFEEFLFGLAMYCVSLIFVILGTSLIAYLLLEK